jgi:hypothetical protein
MMRRRIHAFERGIARNLSGCETLARLVWLNNPGEPGRAARE